MVNGAGGSAWTQYERRRAADREVIRRNLHRTIPALVLTPILVYLAVRLGAHLLNNMVEHIHAPATTADPHPPTLKTAPISVHLANLAGIVLAIAATLGAAKTFWGPRQVTEAWRRGAEGEEAVGRYLDSLAGNGNFVLHDRRIANSRANIDHLLIGPGGVHVIDTKNYTGRVTFSKGTLWHGRHPLTKKLETVKWEAEQVRRQLPTDTAVKPVMCITGATLPEPVMVVGDVTVVGGAKRLVNGLRSAPQRLSGPEIEAIASAAEKAFPSKNGSASPSQAF